MIQIIPNRKKSFSEHVLEGVNAVSPALQEFLQKRELQNQMNSENEILKRKGLDLSGITDPKKRQDAFQYFLEGQKNKSNYERELKGQKELQEQKYDLKNKNEKNLLNQKQDFLSDIFNKSGSQSSDQASDRSANVNQTTPSSDLDVTQLSDANIAKAASIDPNLGRALSHAKDIALRENRENQKRKRDEFEGERKYHSSYSKKAEEEVDNLRNSLPKKESALDFARNAIETGNIEYLSADNLADATGIDIFRTAKGAQLITAGKENLLSNMSKVSSRGQNMWFEQRLNSMFPKIGQSNEANLTVQEMLEGELALDQSYLKEFDRLTEEDEKDYGYVRKDINKRAHDAIKHKEKDIFNRTSYRMREIEEQEKGLNWMKKDLGKNVPKGTPLTLAMAKLYKEKFGENAQQVAKKNGYYIPTLEEFKLFRETPREFREEF